MKKCDVLLKLIMINCFVSMTNKIYPDFLSLGKVIGFFIIVNLILIYIETLKKSDLIFLFYILGFTLLTILRIDDIGVDLEHLIFYTSTTMMLWKFSESDLRSMFYKIIKKNSKNIDSFLKIMIIVIGLSMILPLGWNIVNGQRVLFGFCESGHKMAGNLCLLAFLYFVLHYEDISNTKELILYLIVTAIVLLTGSRTYLISFFIFLLIVYFTKYKKSKNVKILIPFAVMVIGYLFINSSVFSRFTIMGNNTHISNNFLEASSSGRLIWWKLDLNAYKNFDVLHKIIGVGFTELYNINAHQYGLSISAHNDFLTLLVSTGLYGVIGYLIILKRWFFKKIDSNMSKIVIFLLILIYIFNAMINGVYGAQQYIFGILILNLITINIKKDVSNE